MNRSRARKEVSTAPIDRILCEDTSLGDGKNVRARYEASWAIRTATCERTFVFYAGRGTKLQSYRVALTRCNAERWSLATDNVT